MCNVMTSVWSNEYLLHCQTSPHNIYIHAVFTISRARGGFDTWSLRAYCTQGAHDPPLSRAETPFSGLFQPIACLHRAPEHHGKDAVRVQLPPSSQNGRLKVLERFWMLRRGLELPVQARPTSAPIMSNARSHPSRTSIHISGCKQESSGKSGVIECIDGIIRDMELGIPIQHVSIPILLIASSQDTLDPSKEAEVSVCSV